MKENLPDDDMSNDFKDLPHVSLIIPFRSEMTKQRGLLKVLANSADKAEQDLMREYSNEEASPVMKKLRHLIQKVKCSKNEKTLAIFVSPSSEKIYYFTPSNESGSYIPVLVQNNI